jgi:hypothetical protein
VTHLRPHPLERLVDAKPRLENGFLSFECPFHGVHPEWGQCVVSIPIKPTANGWDISGAESMETLTVSPSIKKTAVASECFWHGFVRNGRFEHCGDSR